VLLFPQYFPSLNTFLPSTSSFSQHLPSLAVFLPLIFPSLNVFLSLNISLALTYNLPVLLSLPVNISLSLIFPPLIHRLSYNTPVVYT
jgi:hypothetical protein